MSTLFNSFDTWIPKLTSRNFEFLKVKFSNIYTNHKCSEVLNYSATKGIPNIRQSMTKSYFSKL